MGRRNTEGRPALWAPLWAGAKRGQHSREKRSVAHHRKKVSAVSAARPSIMTAPPPCPANSAERPSAAGAATCAPHPPYSPRHIGLTRCKPRCVRPSINTSKIRALAGPMQHSAAQEGRSVQTNPCPQIFAVSVTAGRRDGGGVLSPTTVQPWCRLPPWQLLRS